MNLAQSGLNLDTDDLKQAGNLGLWKAVPKFDAARGMKFLTYAAPAIRNAMMDMVRDAFTAFEQRMLTVGKDGVCYQRVSLDDVLPGEEQLRRIEAIADPYAMQPQSIVVG
jgi:RNA polymerase primary sigma factor/RNA polymerase sporulation-specific sigma factor